jgi:preprotein translocase subunit SecA
VIPDLITAYHEIDTDPGLSPKQKEEKRAAIQAEFEEKTSRIHHVSQLLRAYCLYEKDVEYVVQNNQVLIVDEFTGRILPGRRWSEGLHQAVEAKEGVAIEAETQTLATITIQNYFRLYEKLAGMTGTAETEAGEFHQIYKLDVVVIPPNKPCVRDDSNDVIYKTRKDKFNSIIKEIQEMHANGRPVLVGTIAVDSSELLSRMLKRLNIPHSVLNAKYHQQEAEIVSRAGQQASVTIKLGSGIADRGGLHVVGTERHESRRIDRQLRGRCARQGDPGSSKFFISLEDDLMRLFARGRMSKIMEKFGFSEGEELQHPLLNRSVETAQKRVEEHNFSIRKHTLEYDDVMNKQREIIYGFRNQILRGETCATGFLKSSKRRFRHEPMNSLG